MITTIISQFNNYDTKLNSCFDNKKDTTITSASSSLCSVNSFITVLFSGYRLQGESPLTDSLLLFPPHDLAYI